MPGWQRDLQPHVDRGALVVIGVVQEQYADRARLYAQWRKIDWPIFVDPLNQLGHRAVPIPMAINMNGQIIFDRFQPDQHLRVFLNKDFRRVELPKVWDEHPGDKLFLAGKLDEAVKAYAKGPDFRLGVALRARGDGQAAVDAWTRALASDPNQYIWRRRLQQYGPLLSKPYNFYGWVEQARKEIRARGEEPVPLAVEPRGSEILGRGEATVTEGNPDPDGKIARDPGLVAIEATVTPARVRPGGRVRVRLTLRVRDAFWNNESDPLTVYVGALKGTVAHPNAKQAETQEERIVEFEVDAQPTLKLYALYNVCEKKAGVCRYLRQDVEIPVILDPGAPSLR